MVNKKFINLSLKKMFNKNTISFKKGEGGERRGNVTVLIWDMNGVKSGVCEYLLRKFQNFQVSCLDGKEIFCLTTHLSDKKPL